MTTDPARDGAAEADVTAGLRALSQAYPELPSAVAERLDRALADLPELTAPDTAPQPAPPRKPPWWRKRYALASASLAVVAFVAGGLLFAAQPWQTSSEGASSSAQDNSNEKAEPFGNKEKGDDAPGEGEGGVGAEVEPYFVTFSNRDYRDSSLTEAQDVDKVGDRSKVPTSLLPLTTSPEARDHCVSLLNREFDGTTDSVDFGQYEGEPAMVAVVMADSGGGTAVAVGPRCGVSDTQVLGTAKF